MPAKDPIRPTDDDARALARTLLTGTGHAALAVIDPDSAAPFVSRIALGVDPAGVPVTLISTLSHHTGALRKNPACSLLVGEPGAKGDPLTHPRLTLQARAAFIQRGSDGHQALRSHYLQSHPKAKLYVDFADFTFVRFTVLGAFLNGGFGKAFCLTAEDLGI